MSGPRGGADSGKVPVPFHAVVPAAGLGSRFDPARPKQTWHFAGRPLLVWTLEALARPGCASLVVALPEPWLDWGRERLADWKPRLVSGGATRQESVARALAGSPARPEDLVLVHDGARPALAEEDLYAVLEAASRTGAAVLGRPVADTLRRRIDVGRWETVDRSNLFAMETPQVFRREILEAALQRAARERRVGTDEASLVEVEPAIRIELVEARFPNPKLTIASDRDWIEWLLETRSVRRAGPIP